MQRSASKPLSGCRVVVTRAEGQADELTQALRAAGAEPLSYPTIAFAPPDDAAPLDAGLRRCAAGGYDWLLLTSATTARVIAQRLVLLGLSPQALHGVRLGAVGPATAQAARSLLGLEATVLPEEYVAEGLAVALGDVQGQRVLLPASDLARPALRTILLERGASVAWVVAYRTVAASGGSDMVALLRAGAVDALTFASPSAVRFFIERVGTPMLPLARQAVVACIGPVTARAAGEAGLQAAVVADPSTAEGLVAALAAYVAEAGVLIKESRYE